jgi:hypothetical protein
LWPTAPGIILGVLPESLDQEMDILPRQKTANFTRILPQGQ